MKDTLILTGQMVVAFLIVDILKDYCKSGIKWAWNEAVGTVKFMWPTKGN